MAWQISALDGSATLSRSTRGPRRWLHTGRARTIPDPLNPELSRLRSITPKREQESTKKQQLDAGVEKAVSWRAALTLQAWRWRRERGSS